MDGREAFFLMLCNFFTFFVSSPCNLLLFKKTNPIHFKSYSFTFADKPHRGPSPLAVCPVAYWSTSKSGLWVSGLPAFVRGALSARRALSGPVSLPATVRLFRGLSTRIKLRRGRQGLSWRDKFFTR